MNILIEGGTQAGNNLFHSFSQFSVPTGSTVYFNNDIEIRNIISRVTGSHISNINGLLKANGNANLFFVNPSGIVLGPNARIEIGGSFLTTTADSIVFADGFEYGAKTTQPLLTVNTPIGLKFSNNLGAINVQGKGHDLLDTPFSPYIRRSSINSLSVKPNQTLALVGSEVNLLGGVLTSEGGMIEISSIKEGFVGFNHSTNNWKFDYGEVLNFGDINLDSKALVDASGIGSGFIQMQGSNIALNDGSVVLIQTQGNESVGGGGLSVKASESLTVRGVASDQSVRSSLSSETLGNGQGVDVVISTPELIIDDGSISTTTYGIGNGGDLTISTNNLNIVNGGAVGTSTAKVGRGGNLNINASENIEIVGVSPLIPDAVSSISSAARGSGRGGDVSVSAKQLVIKGRGIVATNVLYGTGQGGNVTLNISNSVKLIGERNFIIPSSLASSTFGSGDAGNLTLNTSQLSLQNGAQVTAATASEGDAGNLLINAFDFVEIEEGASINSSAQLLPESLRSLLNLPSNLSGSSGNLIINTSNLRIKDGGQVTVRNNGTGDAGTIQIIADSIQLDKSGSISATTNAGKGGNILLNSQDLRLRNNSSITASAGGNGDGGNINIETDLLTALENSSITANAIEGRGGNIRINTQGLFFSPDSKITATSEAGLQFNGTIQISSSYTEFAKAAEVTPSQTESPEVVSVCQSKSGTVNSLINAGTGGIPNSPNDPLSSISGWHDNSVSSEGNQNLQGILTSNESKKYVEAQGWKWNPNGTLSTTLEPETGEVVPYGSLKTPPCRQAIRSNKNSN